MRFKNITTKKTRDEAYKAMFGLSKHVENAKKADKNSKYSLKVEGSGNEWTVWLMKD